MIHNVLGADDSNKRLRSELHQIAAGIFKRRIEWSSSAEKAGAVILGTW